MSNIDRASVALFGSRVLSKVLGFVSVVYFARAIGADGLGVYFTFVTVVSVTSVFAKAGLPSALVKRMNQADGPTQRGAYLTGALALLVPPLIVVSLGLVGFGPQLSAYVGLAAIAPVVVAGVAVGAASTMFVAALRGEARVATTAGVELVGQVVRLAVSVALLFEGYGALGLVFGSVFGNVVRSLVAYGLLETTFGLPSAGDLRHLLDFSKYTVGMNVSGLAYNWADTLVLAAFASKAAVGVYETAWMLSAVTLLGAKSLGVSLAPTMTRWHEAGEREKIEVAFSEGVSFGVMLVVPALVGAVLLGDPVLSTLYGYETGATVLVVLLAGQLAAAVKNITQNTLFGIDRPEHVFWTNAVTLAANVVLNVLLVPRYGMLGAAAATAATASVTVVGQLAYLDRYLSVRVDYRTLAWQIASALLMGGVVVVLAARVPVNSIVGLLAVVAVGAAVYGAGVLANDDLRDRLLGIDLR